MHVNNQNQNKIHDNPYERPSATPKHSEYLLANARIYPNPTPCSPPHKINGASKYDWAESNTIPATSTEASLI